MLTIVYVETFTRRLKPRAQGTGFGAKFAGEQGRNGAKIRRHRAAPVAQR